MTVKSPEQIPVHNRKLTWYCNIGVVPTENPIKKLKRSNAGFNRY